MTSITLTAFLYPSGPPAELYKPPLSRGGPDQNRAYKTNKQRKRTRPYIPHVCLQNPHRTHPKFILPRCREPTSCLTTTPPRPPPRAPRMWMITTPLHGPKYAASCIVQARTRSRARMRSWKVSSNGLGLSGESEVSCASRWNGRTRSRSEGAASEAGRLTQTLKPSTTQSGGDGPVGVHCPNNHRVFFLSMPHLMCYDAHDLSLLTSLCCIVCTVRRYPCMTRLGTCITC